ncbi:MAG: zinc ribbon domain-containing protein [Gemmatimonadota bacterium]|nr:zinc ribbon domain-containing protein [Gemmatimonadota bacterium]
METIAPCPNCRGSNLFRSREVSAGGGHAPNFLPGLGSFWSAGKFVLVACGDCGLTRFFARPEATAKLPDSPKWTRV